MSGAAEAGVDRLRVGSVDAAEQDREGVGALRNHDQMYVIRHEAIGQDPDAGIVEVPLQGNPGQ